MKTFDELSAMINKSNLTRITIVYIKNLESLRDELWRGVIECPLRWFDDAEYELRYEVDCKVVMVAIDVYGNHCTTIEKK